jgi:hypothetical protein
VTTRFKAFFIAVNVSVLLWVGIVAGGSWAWSQLGNGVDHQTTASLR